MKEFFALMGFGTGMIAGVMLYKYSQSFKEGVDKGEKKVMQATQNLEDMAEEKIENAENKIKQGMKKIKRKTEKLKNQINL